MTEALRIAELLAARLCHDLAGLIGSLSQALELVEGDNEALLLARQSAGDLVQRLRLKRAAWAPDTPPLGLAALRGLAAPTTLDLVGLPDDAVFSGPMARVLLNLLLLAREGSGAVRLAGGPTDLFLMLDGPGAMWPPDLAATLLNPVFTDASALQMPLTVLLARALGIRLSLLMPARSGGPPPLRVQIL